MIAFLKEFLEFARQSRKFWLFPVLVLLFLFGGLALLAGTSPIAPFIYALF